MKPHWLFLLISFVINTVFGIFELLKVDDFVAELFANFKPEGFMLIIMIVEYLFILICCHFLDNPKRSLTKRYTSMKHTTFLRRINSLSLSAFVFSSVMNKKIFTIFQLPFLFGPAIDREQEQCIWNWPVVALYSFTAVFVGIGIARLWEYMDFRFSIEQQLAFIMQWLFQRPYNKVDYKKNIYGPLQELQDEIAESMHGVVVEVTESGVGRSELSGIGGSGGSGIDQERSHENETENEVNENISPMMKDSPTGPF